MNDKQKIFVMVGVGSIALLIISMTALQWSFERPFSRLILGKNPHWKTNWLGIIAVFNIVVSFVGFFLFKDK